MTDDGSRTLVRNDSGDGYHSGCGALAETRLVYLHNSGIRERLTYGQASSVLEIGLGTGMNMLATVDVAVRTGASLRYTAWEADWVPADVLQQLSLGNGLRNPSLADRFVGFRDTIGRRVPDGVYFWTSESHGESAIHVELHIGDVREEPFPHRDCYDAIYFDPFAPASNPDLWQLGFFEKMHTILVPGGRLTTYCCSRVVRDRMKAAGFELERVPGPINGKREVLVATRPV